MNLSFFYTLAIVLGVMLSITIILLLGLVVYLSKLKKEIKVLKTTTPNGGNHKVYGHLDEFNEQGMSNGFVKRNSYVNDGELASPIPHPEVSIIDEIIKYDPCFMTNTINKTRLNPETRLHPQTLQPLSLECGFHFNPEETVRLWTYYNCLVLFGLVNVEIEFPIQAGTKTFYADVVVFKNGLPHTQNNIIYIFECKKHTINKRNYTNHQPETETKILTSGYKQLTTYMTMCQNCQMGILTNGVKAFFYQPIMTENGIQIVASKTPNWWWDEKCNTNDNTLNQYEKPIELANTKPSTPLLYSNNQNITKKSLKEQIKQETIKHINPLNRISSYFNR